MRSISSARCSQSFEEVNCFEFLISRHERVSVLNEVARCSLSSAKTLRARLRACQSRLSRFLFWCAASLQTLTSLFLRSRCRDVLWRACFDHRFILLMHFAVLWHGYLPFVSSFLSAFSTLSIEYSCERAFNFITGSTPARVHLQICAGVFLSMFASSTAVTKSDRSLILVSGS